jgi:hypothetical protein
MRAALAATLVLGLAPVARAAPAVRFAVTYTGSGSWHTVYHATPPNEGGAPDTNDAHDSSTQRWALRFTRALQIPDCSAPSNPCRHVGGLVAARGRTSVSGTIDHTHKDGLFADDDMAESCRTGASTPKALALHAAITVGYRPAGRRITLRALTPLTDVYDRFNGTCRHSDSLDGLSDNYFTPGFSFADGFGPERWFTSHTITMSATRLRRAQRVRVRLGDTRAGTPPADCAVAHPDYERCTTGGSWSGVLTLSRRPGARAR